MGWVACASTGWGVPEGRCRLEITGGVFIVWAVSTVQEIEAAIDRLSPREFFALIDRLREKHPDAWDRQIEQDSKSGALDFLGQEVDAEIVQKKARPTDELLDNR